MESIQHIRELLENSLQSVSFSWWIWPLLAASLLIPLSILSTRKHRAQIKSANRHLAYIQTLENPEHIFNYLRNQVDPYEFEEMVLTAIQRTGAKVFRNSKYVADGGYDGAFKLNSKRYLVQSKKYKGYINPKHVTDFRELCQYKKKVAGGYFIHTGKTGPKSMQNAGDIEIISGQRLVSLFKATK